MVRRSGFTSTADEGKRSRGRSSRLSIKVWCGGTELRRVSVQSAGAESQAACDVRGLINVEKLAHSELTFGRHMKKIGQMC